MRRFVALCFVLTFVSVCRTDPQKIGNVTAVDGRISFGEITGGTFGSGSFSIGAPGQKMPSKFETEDGVPVVTIKPKPHRHRDHTPPQRDSPNIPNMEDDKEIRPGKHQKIHDESGHGGKRGEGGKGFAQITIGKVNVNQENIKGNNHQEPVTLLAPVYTSNRPISASQNKATNFALESVNGGTIETGAVYMRPKNNIPNKTFNHFNDDHYTQGAGIRDGAHSNGNDNGHRYTGGSNERWVWQ